MKALDSFSYGCGLRTTDSRCKQTRDRYLDFRSWVRRVVSDFKEMHLQEWDEFLEALKGTEMEPVQPYIISELPLVVMEL